MFWQTSRRQLSFERPLVMGILNVTPDSFSDGGEFLHLDDALKQARKFIKEGADIIDVGGESTRPGSVRVSKEEEIRRVVPIIAAITKRFDVPISTDTSRSSVAEKAVEAGAEIINDISALRFDDRIGDIATKHRAGLILMHSRGSFEAMHKQEPVADIIAEVTQSLRASIEKAAGLGVKSEQIALDVGIGFSKRQEQNLELIAKLGIIASEFADFPIAVGVSRKSFIGKILGIPYTGNRLAGSLACSAVAVMNGANIVRVHDVKETIEAIKVVSEIRQQL